MAEQLPVIDLAALAPGAPGREMALIALREAAHRYGFFQLTGHGVPAACDIALRAQAEALFALPEDEKRAIAMLHSPQFRGYTQMGAELTRGRADWREQIDFGREEPARPLSRKDAPALRLHGPNQWPAALPGFRPAVEAWQQAMEYLLLRVLRACVASLGQPREALQPLYGERPWWTMKLIRYPAQASEGQGVGAHKDGELLSLIAQDAVGGLQVEAADGTWIDAQPTPGCYVVNIGEQLELASDGYFKAAVHRVRSPASGQARLSAAFFLGARLDSRIPALTLPPALAAQARGYTRDPGNPLLHDVGANTLKGRLRSHPDVARVHHADLLDGASSMPSRTATPR
ncbi:Isopenicillin N synthase [Pseudoxanthomonas sp. GM95]|uniref:isopenicillin N synthase family dioxygenase n=1 Tax=Pseudoxanthomonas sp. GM95 TaxID=1881043 RepID=UPI0008BE41EB|nr:2-oxoglutarate and iron-dependent oxygenase domain-containing protein [Pseudoxanthomonas sp. GM95]SEK88564.1 Isopenicillin N synthase [Pseudoxanthomonas sp. GM95]